MKLTSYLYSSFLTLMMLTTFQVLADEIPVNTAQSATAIFAGGCFWCMEPPYDKLDGVISTISGYSDGHKKTPTYKEVSSGRTGHTEVVQITYDPARVSYKKLLEVFWINVDPTRDDGQFCDTGNQYRPAIFYQDSLQQQAAMDSLREIENKKTFSASIKVEIKEASVFYPAEEYHQDYYIKNPIRYKYYRYSCGRDKRLETLWGEMSG